MIGSIDPVVLICAGIIAVGLAALWWAFKAYTRAPKAPARPSEPAPVPFPRFTPIPTAPAPPKAPPSEPSKEIQARLDDMARRLSEMQTALTRQMGADPAPSADSGGGLPKETLEKLLDIIHHVNQQVEILKDTFGGAEPPSEPANAPKLITLSEEITQAGPKSIGVPGGLLSSMPKKKDEEPKPGEFSGMRSIDPGSNKSSSTPPANNPSSGK